MKKYLPKVLVLIFLSALFTSCGKVKTIQTLPAVERQSTPAIFLAPTVSPTPESIIMSTVMPLPTTLADATVQAFDSVLCNSKVITWWDMSPNGKWLAATCYWENGKEESPLRVSSMDRSRDWKIYFSAHLFSVYLSKIGLSLDRHDEVRPYHWSKDGRFLFATVGSRLEGCCWIGGRYVLLVRLNLETGEQIAILRTDYYSANTFDFIISDSDRYLLFTPPSKQPYDFAILDFQTWETQKVFLKFQKDIDVIYAKISPKEDKVILPLFKNIEFNDYYVDSIAVVDFITGRQDILITDLTPEKEFFPIRWIDDSHVLLSNINPVYNVGNQKARYWLLDIKSGQLEEETP